MLPNLPLNAVVRRGLCRFLYRQYKKTAICSAANIMKCSLRGNMLRSVLILLYRERHRLNSATSVTRCQQV